MLVGFAASSRTLRQAPQTLYKTVTQYTKTALKMITKHEKPKQDFV
jgi:hypothetical protein